MKEVVIAVGDQADPAKLYIEAVQTADSTDQRTCLRNKKQVRTALINNVNFCISLNRCKCTMCFKKRPPLYY